MAIVLVLNGVALRLGFIMPIILVSTEVPNEPVNGRVTFIRRAECSRMDMGKMEGGRISDGRPGTPCATRSPARGVQFMDSES